MKTREPTPHFLKRTVLLNSHFFLSLAFFFSSSSGRGDSGRSQDSEEQLLSSSSSPSSGSESTAALQSSSTAAPVSGDDSGSAARPLTTNAAVGFVQGAPSASAIIVLLSTALFKTLLFFLDMGLSFLKKVSHRARPQRVRRNTASTDTLNTTVNSSCSHPQHLRSSFSLN
ncbi:hypothetical protein U1Q18_051437 [Sarracenia purpurea var. burkii]